MPTITVPEETFQRLTRRAAALRISVEELAVPVLKRLATEPVPVAAPDLSHEEWLANLNAWMAEVQARAHLYPPGFEADVSREAIYEGCGE